MEEPNGGTGAKKGHDAAVPKTDPTGPETDLAAGKRLCFVEDNWAEGLPLLAKGSDDRLRELATADLKDNASPQERVTLGDRWWDFAGSEVGAVWKGSLRRAAYWYRQAARIRRARRPEIEKRLKNMEEQPPGLEVLSRRAQVFPDDTHGFARAANLLLEVGKNEKQSAGASFAGVEIKGVRHLDVAVKASANIERLAHLSFAGFIVDYHVGSQYTKRVGLSMGEFDERQRKGNKPLWGKLDMTDEYINLGKHDLYRLDLQEWAPPGWDGQSWVTLALQHAGLGTSITAQLAPLAKRQEERKPLDLPVKPKEAEEKELSK
ncbi:MAG: hypothetical protein ACLQNE_32160 [Thermoguttaceae bacterium]